MKLTGKLFKEICGILSATYNKKGSLPLPYLENAVIQPENVGTSIIATDLDIFVKIGLPYHTISETSILPIADLQKLATKSNVKDEIVIDGSRVSIDNMVKIFQPKSDIDQFPVYPVVNHEAGIISQKVLFNTMNEMTKFKAKDDYRATLNCINFNFEKNEICATDGRALLVRNDNPFYSVSEESVIVPDFNHILKKIKTFKPESSVEIKRLGDWIKFEIECDTYHLSIVVRTESGVYPPYRKAFPNESGFTSAYSINCKDIEKVCKYFDGTTTNQTIIHVTENGITYSQENIDNNSVTEIKGRVSFHEELGIQDHAFGVNYNFLNKFVRKGINQLDISFTGRNNAIVIDTDNYKGLLMPVKINLPEDDASFE